MSARSRRRLRLWFEIGIVAVSGILWIATLVWPDWIELLFHVDPDEGNGSVERALTVLLPVVGVAVAVLAGRDWRRSRSEPETGRG